LFCSANHFDGYLGLDSSDRVFFIDPNLTGVPRIEGHLLCGSGTACIAKQLDLNHISLGLDRLAIPQHPADIGCRQTGKDRDGH
jgi:hypothetical protein